MATLVFDTQAPAATRRLELRINGTTRSVELNEPDLTLRDFVLQQAQAAGIRTFSVYANGGSVDQAAAERSITEFSSVEIVPKDARG